MPYVFKAFCLTFDFMVSMSSCSNTAQRSTPVVPSCLRLAVAALACLSAWLLVCELPMFSLKFKDLSWQANRLRFLFLAVCIPLLAVLGISGFAAIVVWYILLSLLTCKRKPATKPE